MSFIRTSKLSSRDAIARNKPYIIPASFAEADTMTYKILAVLLFAFTVAACGQSGALYVPGDPSSVQKPQPVPEAEEDGEENGEDDSR